MGPPARFAAVTPRARLETVRRRCALHEPPFMTASETLPASMAPMPEAVTSFGAVTLDDWLYVCGGHRGTRHAYSVDSVSGALLRLAEGQGLGTTSRGGPGPGAPLVAHGRHVYRIGGMAARNHPGEPGDLHSKARVDRFDVVRGEWETFPALPEPRSSHDAVVAGDHLYVGGGWKLSGSFRGEWLATLLRIDLRNPAAGWESIPPALPPSGSGARRPREPGLRARGPRRPGRPGEGGRSLPGGRGSVGTRARSARARSTDSAVPRLPRRVGST